MCEHRMQKRKNAKVNAYDGHKLGYMSKSWAVTYFCLPDLW